MHLEAVGFSATQPNTGAAGSAFSGDSLTTKNARTGSKILIVSHFADQQTAGWQQMTHPSGHDTTRGYRVSVTDSEVEDYIPDGCPIPMQPQELMSITIAGSNTAGDVEQGCFNIFYEDSPFVVGNLITYAELMSRIVDLTTVMCTIAATAGPGWTGSEAINAESDLLRANTPYAILGVVAQVEALAVGIRAPDFGGQRIAAPCNPTHQKEGANYFASLAKRHGLPLIPVFNSANRANVLIDAAQDENGADPIVSLMLAQLK